MSAVMLAAAVSGIREVRRTGVRSACLRQALACGDTILQRIRCSDLQGAEAASGHQQDQRNMLET